MCAGLKVIICLLVLECGLSYAQQGYDYNSLAAEGREKTKAGSICWFIPSWGRKNEIREEQMFRFITHKASCGPGKTFTDVLMAGKVRCIEPNGIWGDLPVSCSLKSDGSTRTAAGCIDDVASAVYTREEFEKYLGSIEKLVSHKNEILEQVHRHE
jgi:hypothetical protein